MKVTTTTRFFFDDIGSAAQAMKLLLLDARKTKEYYTFSGRSAQEILVSGLLLQGSIDQVVKILEQVPGSLRHDE